VALSQTPHSKAGTKREIPPLIAKGRDVTLVYVHENFVKGILDRIGRRPTTLNARLPNITVQAGYLGSQMRDKRGGGSERKKVSVRVW
jgi:hypothetical protein